MKKILLLIVTSITSIYLTGCATYVPENTEHEDVVIYDSFERFLEHKTNNYSIINTFNNETHNFLYSDGLIKDTDNDVIQEEMKYLNVDEEECVLYVMYYLGDDIKTKELEFDKMYHVQLLLNQINYSDFNRGDNGFELKPGIDYNVDNLKVIQNEETKLFDFYYDFDGVSYVTTFELQEEVVDIPQESTTKLNYKEKISDFYDTFKNAESFNTKLDVNFWSHHIKGYSKIIYVPNITSGWTTAHLKYEDYSYEVLDLTDKLDDISRQHYLFNIFELETKESFLRRFDYSIYEEDTNTYITIYNGNTINYTFDFELNELVILEVGSELISYENVLYKFCDLNSEDAFFEVPTVTYTNLMQ